MKKLILGLLAASLAVTLCACGESSSSYSGGYSSGSSGSSGSSYSSSGESYAYDWMKEQAEGKDYSYDDGGSYYCMGKNDTCPNKTSNAYDLYCSSCDPDGDNIEG